MNTKTLKRVIAIMCILSMMFALSGCGNKGKKVDNTFEDTKNLVIMIPKNGYGTDYVTKLAEAFEKQNEGVDVKIEIIAPNSAQVSETLKNYESNDIDLYFNVEPAALAEEMRHAWNGEQALRDMTYLYDSQIPGEEKTLGQKVNASYKRSLQVEGRTTEDASDDVYYGVPMLTGLMGLYYNETVIDNALGKGNWSVPNTTDELLALCEQLKQKDVHFLMPGGIDGFSLSMIPTWWAQYEGYENYLKFYEGIGYDSSKDREVENSEYIFTQPGRKAALEVSYELVGHKNGYALSNSVEINTSVLNEYQSRFFVSKNNYAFYPCGSWLPNEVKSNSGIEYDSVVKMMKTPVISSIIESTDSYSGSDDKRLPNIISDAILSQTIAYVDGKGELPAGVTEEEVEIIRQTRKLASANSGGIVAPAYSNAKKLADKFLLFMASDEGIKIVKENSYGSFLAYDCEYEGLDEIEASLEAVSKDAIYVGDFKYHPLFLRGGISGLVGAGGNTLDAALCQPNGKTGTEIFNEIVNTYSGSKWNSIMSKVQ